MATEHPLVFHDPRQRVYPRSVKGKFRNIKHGILILAYSVFFLLPYLRWDRGPSFPDQAILFDLPHRAFYIFGLTMWPQEVIWLAIFLLFAAVLLFFVTGIAGRLFCGYFCFQTLWTDLYMTIERWVEGDRTARMRLDDAPWSFHKARLKLEKHVLWLGVAFLTGISFTGYFTDVFGLWRNFFLLQAASAAYITTLILTLTTYTMAGLMREQVCTSFCPYGRFQSVMFDENTTIVAYDTSRGEATLGRHKPVKGETVQARKAVGRGDCIDCGLCVQVCPTGIDIRNGLQYQCIGCGLCVDACNNVMDSMKLPQGLIRYTSEKELKNEKANHWTPKTLAYAVVLGVVAVWFAISMATRSTMLIDVQQERQPLYVQLSDGRIQNKYEIRVTNKLDEAHNYRIDVLGLPQAQVQYSLNPLRVNPGETLGAIIYVRVPPTALKTSRLHFRFQVTELGTKNKANYETDFYAPEDLVGGEG